MRAVLVGMAAAVLVAAGGGVAAQDDKIDGKLLVGKWAPKAKDGGKEFVVEFAKGGKLTVQIKDGEKEQKLEGTYKLSGNKLSYTVKIGDEEKSESRTISKLTRTELVSAKEEGGKEETLYRVGPKTIDKK